MLHHLPKENSTGNTYESNHYNVFENYTKWKPHPAGGNELTNGTVHTDCLVQSIHFTLKLGWKHIICNMAFILLQPQSANSLWPSDAIWPHRSGSTLTQVMACCLTAPSHYRNQWWLIIKAVLWHSPEGNFTRSAHELKSIACVRNYPFKSTTTSPRGQWVNSSPPSAAYMRQWIGRVSIGSDNGLLPVRRKAITWTNPGLLSIGLLRINFSEILIGILSFSFKKMHLKLSSAKMTAILSGGRWVNSTPPVPR